jgi:hypothetical protein
MSINQTDDQTRPPEPAAGPPPYAVSVPEAKRLLGDKSHGGLYQAIGLGKLVALKDGSKTLITSESIRAYMTSLPRAQIKAPKPRSSRQPPRKRQKK